MALIKCKECGKEVSDKAETCPHCGYKIPRNSFQNDGFVVNMNNSNYNVEKKKGSDTFAYIGLALSILSLLFGCCNGYIGIIISALSIIFAYRSYKKTSNKSNLILIIVVAAIAILISFFSIGSSDNKSDKKVTNTIAPTIQQANETAKTAEKTEKPKKEKQKTTPTPKPTKKPKTAKQIKKEYIASCKEYKYKDVLRNPSDYTGKKVKIKLKILSVHEESVLNDTKYYIAYSKGEYGWYENMYAVFDKRISDDLKLLEDDIIEVYGEIAEPEDTVSLIVASSEVFAINMKYVKLIDE